LQKNLFNKYIKKIRFWHYIIFFAKKYVITKVKYAKADKLLANYLKNVLGPFIKPHNINYSHSINNIYSKFAKINNKLCSYNCNDEYMKILNEKDIIIDEQRIGKNINKILEYNGSIFIVEKKIRR
jgi:hypothetical protein